jgi:hypothetical protein
MKVQEREANVSKGSNDVTTILKGTNVVFLLLAFKPQLKLLILAAG